MRLALIRHFRVVTDGSWRTFLSPSEFETWMKLYDACPVAVPDTVLPPGGSWQVCFTSDSDRAVATASRLHGGEIVATELLREIPVAPVYRAGLRLPLFMWFFLGRLGWFFGCKTQPENRLESQKRIEAFLSLVESGGYDSVLAVGHGGLMLQFRSILRKRGFRGKHFLFPENGRCYVYGKEEPGARIRMKN